MNSIYNISYEKNTFNNWTFVQEQPIKFPIKLLLYFCKKFFRFHLLCIFHAVFFCDSDDYVYD